MIIKTQTKKDENCPLCNRNIPTGVTVLEKVETKRIICILCLVEIAELAKVPSV